jgi:hypothetical protein
MTDTKLYTDEELAAAIKAMANQIGKGWFNWEYVRMTVEDYEKLTGKKWEDRDGDD